MRQTERSPSEKLFWPVVWAVGLHAMLFAFLFVSFARTPELPPSRPVIKATLYQLQSQSQATTQTNGGGNQGLSNTRRDRRQSGLLHLG